MVFENEFLLVFSGDIKAQENYERSVAALDTTANSMKSFVNFYFIICLTFHDIAWSFKMNKEKETDVRQMC